MAYGTVDGIYLCWRLASFGIESDGTGCEMRLLYGYASGYGVLFY